MATVEERMASLEGRAGEHTVMINGIREALIGLEARMDQRLAAFEERVDRRFEAMDRRFESIDRRFNTLDRRVTCLIGLQVTTMASVLAAVVVLVD